MRTLYTLFCAAIRCGFTTSGMNMKASQKPVAKVLLLAGASVAVFATTDAIAALSSSQRPLALSELRSLIAGGSLMASSQTSSADGILVAQFEKTFEKQFDKTSPA